MEVQASWILMKKLFPREGKSLLRRLVQEPPEQSSSHVVGEAGEEDCASKAVACKMEEKSGAIFFIVATATRVT